jgi:hypothetical protein
MILRKSILAAAAITAMALIGCGEDDTTSPSKSSSSVAVSSATSSSGTSSATSSEGTSSGTSSAMSSSSSSEVAKAFCDGKGTILAAGAALKGEITANTCIAKGEYSIDGFAYVKNNAVLSIEPGTVFKSTGASALFITPGAKIMAEGTAAAPIVFTSKEAAPQPGDWAGIVIYGNAPISTANANGSTAFEAIATDLFGGTKADDNSGALKYVRIEYAGREVAKDKELNGLTLAGVGSGTVLENIQVHSGSDDAFEWFGGTVSAKNLVASAGEDDGFDIDEGWQGTISNGLVVGKMANQNGRTAGSDNGIESGSKAGDPNRMTEGTFKNITLVMINELNGNGIDLKDNVQLNIDGLIVVNANTDAAKKIKSVLKVSGTKAISLVNSDKTTIKNAHYEGAFTKFIDGADAGAVAKLEAMIKNTTGLLNADLSAKSDAVKFGADVSAFAGWTVSNSVKMPRRR